MTGHGQLNAGFLSSEEVARALNISTRTLHRWGRLRKGPPSIKVGRSVYYLRSSIERWLLTLENESGIAATVAGRQ
jgi:predicted DNA-binding transcriptional regulator AlpA